MKQKINIRSYLLGLSVLIVGIALSLTGFFYERGFEMSKIAKEFDSYAFGIVSAFEKEVENDIDVLYSLASFYDASEIVTRAEFKLFAKNILKHQDDIMTVDWLPRLLGGDRQLFEESIRKEGYNDFSISQIGPEGRIVNRDERGLYFPICYTEPFEVNEFMFGVDLYSEASRRKAMEDAAGAGGPHATGWITVFREHEGDIGCRVFMPVYGKAVDTQNTKKGLQSVEGFVSVLFELGRTVEVAIKGMSVKDINICAYDDTDMKDVKYVCFRGSRRLSPGTAGDILQMKDRPKLVRTFNFAGRRWNIACTPAPGFYAERNSGIIRPWVFLALCISLSMLVAVYVTELSSRADRVGQEVKEKTSELQDMNRILQVEIAHREKAQEHLSDTYLKLKDTQRGLIQSEKEAALGRFSIGVAHEIKNPLAIILASTDFLEAKLPDAGVEIKESVGRIKAYTLMANDILENILQYARPSELKAEKIGINALVNEIVPLFKIQPAFFKTEIVAELSPEDVHVFVDKNQMDQAIFNILKNAIEACDQGCRVILKTGVAGGFGVIKVVDNGSGMSSQTLSKLFEPFFSTKRPGKGTGLGLFIAKTIIENNKGTLTINSEEGKGAAVSIALPLAI